MIIDSTNAEIPDRLVDYVHTEPTGYSDPNGQDNSDNFASLDASREFPDALWIEPKHWRDKARENDKYGTWAESSRNALGRFTNQYPSHECTCHSLVQGAEAAYRVQSGFEYNICLSPLSVYAEANPRRYGGATLLSVLAIAMDRGILPEPVHGQANIFAHTLHGTSGEGNADNMSGPWVPLQRFPKGWEETARWLRPLEAINPRTIEQAICLILHGYVVNVGRKGHAVPWNHLAWKTPGDYPDLFGYADSYDVVRYDSLRTAKGAVEGASAITLMSTCKVFEDHFYGAAD